jgi:hypothetical protein
MVEKKKMSKKLQKIPIADFLDVSSALGYFSMH